MRHNEEDGGRGIREWEKEVCTVHTCNMEWALNSKHIMCLHCSPSWAPAAGGDQGMLLLHKELSQSQSLISSSLLFHEWLFCTITCTAEGRSSLLVSNFHWAAKSCHSLLTAMSLVQINLDITCPRPGVAESTVTILVLWGLLPRLNLHHLQPYV